MTIGQKIYLLRQQAGLGQSALAARAGIPQPNLSNIEKGKQDLTVTTLRKIAYALNTDVRCFFEEEATRAKKTMKWTRPRIEKVAAAVLGQKKRLTPEEKVIVELARKNLPLKNRSSRIPARDLHKAWMELRAYFSNGELKGLYERIQDAGARMKNDEAKANRYFL